MAVAVRYPFWLRPDLSRACAFAFWSGDIVRNGRPLRGNISLGMKCQRWRSSDA